MKVRAQEGDLAWATRAGGTSFQTGCGISAHIDGTSVVTGYFEGTVVFGQGEPNETTFVSTGSIDVFVARYDTDGSLLWARHAGGTGFDMGTGISAHVDGTSVVTGLFGNSIVFGQGEPNETTLTVAGGIDIFVAKFGADGSLLWARRDGGTGWDEGDGVSAHEDGSSVVTGYFYGASVFGAGEPNETTLVSAGGYDIFVARYDTDGWLLWARRAGGAGESQGERISAHADGTSAAVGIFEGATVFGQGEPNETTLVSAGGYDIFVARYDTDGSLLWAKRAGGGGYDRGTGICAHADGTSVAVGDFEGASVFGAGEPNETTLVSAGGNDIFVARYDTDGSLLWARHAGGSNGDQGKGISAYPDGTSAVTGLFTTQAVFGENEPAETVLTVADLADIFVAEYDAGGSLLWAKRAGGTGFDQPFDISAHADGTSVATGDFSDTAVFGASEPNETTLVSAGGNDIFVARYDGTLQPTLTPTPTPTETPIDTPTPTVTPTSMPTGFPTDTPLPAMTPTETPIPTETPVETPTETSTPAITPPPTATPTAFILKVNFQPDPVPTPSGFDVKAAEAPYGPFLGGYAYGWLP